MDGGSKPKSVMLRSITGRSSRQSFGPQFHWHILDRGIQHRYIRPRRPYLNGKAERSYRIDDEEFYRQLEGVVVSGLGGTQLPAHDV